jgi:hypothetical protein
MASHLGSLARATYDFGLYPEVTQQRLRRSFAFLFLLILLSTIAATVSATVMVHKLAKEVRPAIDKIPTVVIRKGEASANVPQPWVKSFGREHGLETVLIIDTTGTREGFADDQMGVFLKKTSVLVKQQSGESRAIPLDKIDELVLSPDVLHHYLDKLVRLTPFVVAGLMFVWYTTMKLLQTMILVLVGLIAGSGRKRTLRFGELFTIAVYALTPAILADSLLTLMPFGVPYFLLLYWALAIVWTVLGTRRIPDDVPPLKIV